MTKTVFPRNLLDWLDDGDEIAVLDVREHGVFANGHLLIAASVPLSQMELRLDALIPRRSTRLVVCDDASEGLAERAATRLAQLGYSDVSVLEGGVEGWRGAGYEVFSGFNVPSKAFGEFVETAYGTPHLSAEQLQAKIEGAEDLVILDSRPYDEYNRMNIPGGIDAPGAELVYRVHDIAPDPSTLVVVNCAGRTRSIIGAQSLINAGVPNPVLALKDGTMGWHLAGLKVEKGADRRAPEPAEEALAKAKAAAQSAGERFGVEYIDAATLKKWRGGEAETRTTYLFDVRQPEAYNAGHLDGSRNAQGGQLVQGTDEFAPVRGARIVLTDDHGVQSVMTGSWLVQIGGYEVYVLAEHEGARVTGPEATTALGFEPWETCTAVELATEMKNGGIAVIDLAPSTRYEAEHIEGAHWAVRSSLATDVDTLKDSDNVVLTSEDERLAHYAARELAETGRSVRALEGGTDAWKKSGFAMASGATSLLSEPDDVWRKPYDTTGDPRVAMQAYLDWEVELVEQIQRPGGISFRKF
ncbi:MAG: rhodanese-like domain-containing protein [Proteobacteria bacterium]|nr:rhodanese-like domain-containing protein [Pseudomonadota bacterium]